MTKITYLNHVIMQNQDGTVTFFIKGEKHVAKSVGCAKVVIGKTIQKEAK
jgi:hypothetical protein